jgi:hypothetical protein
VSSLQLIVSSSEVLSSTDAMLLRRAFGAPVHDLYGLAEVSTVCFERSPGGGYETVDGRLIVEVLVDARPAEPGETGELVVTSLDNRVMPFIRYATGDLCTLSEKGERSGRAGMLIDRIQGRLVDNPPRRRLAGDVLDGRHGPDMVAPQGGRSSAAMAGGAGGPRQDRGPGSANAPWPGRGCSRLDTGLGPDSGGARLHRGAGSRQRDPA